jgi:hypothetical protein
MLDFQIAQMNIAKFIKPKDHPDNNDFVNNIDLVNSEAEDQDGFVWRFKDEAASPIDLQVFDDPNVIVNMSVWADIASLVRFVYYNDEHKRFMRRRKEWFDKVDFHMVLWWLEAGRHPSLEEGKLRLQLLKHIGPSESAFTFKHAFCAPTGESMDAFKSI